MLAEYAGENARETARDYTLIMPANRAITGDTPAVLAAMLAGGIPRPPASVNRGEIG